MAVRGNNKSLTNADSSQLPKPGINVPAGHIIVSGKWRNNELVNKLQNSVNVLLEDNLGIVDFHTSSDTAVVYVSEADLIIDGGYRRKLTKLRKLSQMRGVVIAEKTAISKPYFPAWQCFCVMELGQVLMPVTSHTEAAGLLSQMVHVEGRLDLNPFRKKRRAQPLDPCLLLTLQSVPKLGEVKAKLLLEKFGSLLRINEATTEVHVEGRLDLNPFRKKRRAQPLDPYLLLTLQSVPKLGEVKAKLLLEKFGSLLRINEATTEDITKVVGKSSAMYIKAFFNQSVS